MINTAITYNHMTPQWMQAARNMARNAYKNSPSQSTDEAFSIVCWHAGGLNSPKGLELN